MRTRPAVDHPAFGPLIARLSRQIGLTSHLYGSTAAYLASRSMARRYGLRDKYVPLTRQY